MKYHITNIITNDEFEISFTMGGNTYLLVTPFICKPDGDDLLCDGYDLYRECAGELREVQEEIIPHEFMEALNSYAKAEKLGREI